MNGLQSLLSASMEELLASGSDTRSAIDAATGRNSYGCTSAPAPDAFSFGSSTASTISRRAFRHVEREREHLLKKLSHPAEMDSLTENLRCALRRLLELEATGAEIVLSPSGTDSVLHALFLVRVLNGGRPADTILAAADETGSSVGAALAGRHFSPMTAGGTAVPQGAFIAGFADAAPVISIKARRPDGVLHAPAVLDRSVMDAVSGSVERGRRVLLLVMDSSKLGARCPSTRCLEEIQTRYGRSVQIVVDACQMRVSRARLRWYLEQKCIVLISGSKFFTGPPFSGALLVPRSLSPAIQRVRCVPRGLHDYTDRSSWPQAWPNIRAAFADRPNFGQYFRWAAALQEMREYFSIPLEFRRAALARFAVMTAGLVHTHGFRLLEKFPADCGDTEMGAIGENEEMEERTIFPFLIPQGTAWMSFEKTARLFRALHRKTMEDRPGVLSPHEKQLAARICHIGQPVSLPCSDGAEGGAMRLCAGARTVTRIWSVNRRHPFDLKLEREANEIGTILDKIALLARQSS